MLIYIRMAWIYQNQPLTEIPDGYVAFVYIITNTTNDRKYIGKKLFKFRKSSKRKGKTVRKQVESDWQDYFGSNKELLGDVQSLGEDKFTREVIRLCKTKGESSYYEAKQQFDNDVLFSDLWYNAWISVKITKTHLKNVSKDNN